MLVVGDVLSDVSRVLGGVDEATSYVRLNDAVEILATETAWDPLLGYVDICVGSDRYVTLPREVGTVLATNITGKPAQAHDFLWAFHLNGPGQGDATKCGYQWYDGLPVATFLDPAPAGAQLVTSLETASDNGKSFRIYGYDINGDWIRSNESGTYVDGFLVPMNFGTSLPNTNAPLVRRITRVSKVATAGVVSLSVLNSDSTLTKIGKYAPDETEPQYRRIRLSKSCTYARIAFRKGTVLLSKPSDLIPLHSRYAIILMVKALKKIDEDRIEEAEKYHELAVNFLTKKQLSIEVPSAPSIQMADGNLLADKSDRME